MNIESMANYADVIGGAAVIVSLIYVGIQIRRNAKSSQSQANQSAHESLASVSLEVSKDPEFSNFVRRGLIEFDELSEDERFRIVMLMTTTFRRYENIFYQYKRGFLEEGLWAGYEQSILLMFYSPGGQAFWNIRSLHFSELFRNYLDSTSYDDVKTKLSV
jgi:hypothetical protein